MSQQEELHQAKDRGDTHKTKTFLKPSQPFHRGPIGSGVLLSSDGKPCFLQSPTNTDQNEKTRIKPQKAQTIRAFLEVRRFSGIE